MNSKLHFLGTGCMVPTKDRNHLSVALEYEGKIFLFDCGEGTQNQIKKMKLPIGKISKIFISHWHGDHTLGLGGLIQTLTNTDNVDKIEIHGPKDTKMYVDHILKSSIFDTRVEIEIHEHNPKRGEVLKIIDCKNYYVGCAQLKHSVDCLGYYFKENDTINVDKIKLNKIAPELEKSPLLARIKMGLDLEYEGKIIKSEDITYKKKGLKVALIFDTRPCIEIGLIAKDSDYLVMEATYAKKHANKADEYEHMTAKESALVALENNVKMLYVTHFSQRYKDTTQIEEEAREVFENTYTTYDLMSVKLKRL